MRLTWIRNASTDVNLGKALKSRLNGFNFNFYIEQYVVVLLIGFRRMVATLRGEHKISECLLVPRL